MEMQYQPLEESKKNDRTEQKKEDDANDKLVLMPSYVPGAIINTPTLEISSIPSFSSSSVRSVSRTPSQVPTTAAHPSSSFSPPPLGDIKEQ